MHGNSSITALIEELRSIGREKRQIELSLENKQQEFIEWFEKQKNWREFLIARIAEGNSYDKYLFSREDLDITGIRRAELADSMDGPVIMLVLRIGTGSVPKTEEITTGFFPISMLEHIDENLLIDPSDINIRISRKKDRIQRLREQIKSLEAKISEEGKEIKTLKTWLH